MTKSRLALAAGLLAVVSSACSTDAPVGPLAEGTPQPLFSRSGQEEDAVVADEILIGLREGASLDEVIRGHGVALSRLGYAGRFAVLSGARGRERALAAILKNDPRVEYAEPNYLRQPDAIDPKLWAFYNPGGLKIYFHNDPDGRTGEVSSKVSVVDADEDAIEGIAGGGSAVVVSSIDTGVQLNHDEFLSGQLIAGKDWVSGDNDPSDEDDHGTHTTGTMVGRNVGVAGVTGAGSNVKVLVQRVCGPNGCPTSAIVNAIYAAADYPGMVAMNLSLGGSRETQSEKNAIKYAVGKNVLVIASAGNSGSGKVACPACDPNAVSVAALNWQDQLSYYSQYGSGLDISAPGGEMYSNTTEEAGIYSSVRYGKYAFFQGTSMAAPQVTGVAAIVASKTGLRGAALRNRILSTADDLGAAGYDTKFGYGRVNAYRAVTGGALPAGQ